MKIKNLTPVIKGILEGVPSARDSDTVLMSMVWRRELNNMGFSTMTLPMIGIGTITFLQFLIDGKISNPESIRRNRQILQSKYPALWGEKKRKRQTEKAERHVREQLREMKEENV